MTPDLRLLSGFPCGMLLSLHTRDTCLHSGSWLLSGFDTARYDMFHLLLYKELIMKVNVAPLCLARGTGHPENKRSRQQGHHSSDGLRDQFKEDGLDSVQALRTKEELPKNGLQLLM